MQRREDDILRGTNRLQICEAEIVRRRTRKWLNKWIDVIGVKLNNTSPVRITTGKGIQQENAIGKKSLPLIDAVSVTGTSVTSLNSKKESASYKASSPNKSIRASSSSSSSAGRRLSVSTASSKRPLPPGAPPSPARSVASRTVVGSNVEGDQSVTINHDQPVNRKLLLTEPPKQLTAAVHNPILVMRAVVPTAGPFGVSDGLAEATAKRRLSVKSKSTHLQPTLSHQQPLPLAPMTHNQFQTPAKPASVLSGDCDDNASNASDLSTLSSMTDPTFYSTPVANKHIPVPIAQASEIVARFDEYRRQLQQQQLQQSHMPTTSDKHIGHNQDQDKAQINHGDEQLKSNSVLQDHIQESSPIPRECPPDLLVSSQSIDITKLAEQIATTSIVEHDDRDGDKDSQSDHVNTIDQFTFQLQRLFARWQLRHHFRSRIDNIALTNDLLRAHRQLLGGLQRLRHYCTITGPQRRQQYLRSYKLALVYRESAGLRLGFNAVVHCVSNRLFGKVRSSTAHEYRLRRIWCEFLRAIGAKGRQQHSLAIASTFRYRTVIRDHFAFWRRYNQHKKRIRKQKRAESVAKAAAEEKAKEMAKEKAKIQEIEQEMEREKVKASEVKAMKESDRPPPPRPSRRKSQFATPISATSTREPRPDTNTTASIISNKSTEHMNIEQLQSSVVATTPQQTPALTIDSLHSPVSPSRTPIMAAGAAAVVTGYNSSPVASSLSVPSLRMNPYPSPFSSHHSASFAFPSAMDASNVSLLSSASAAMVASSAREGSRFVEYALGLQLSLGFRRFQRALRRDIQRVQQQSIVAQNVMRRRRRQLLERGITALVGWRAKCLRVPVTKELPTDIEVHSNVRKLVSWRSSAKGNFANGVCKLFFKLWFERALCFRRRGRLMRRCVRHYRRKLLSLGLKRLHAVVKRRLDRQPTATQLTPFAASSSERRGSVDEQSTVSFAISTPSTATPITTPTSDVEETEEVWELSRFDESAMSRSASSKRPLKQQGQQPTPTFGKQFTLSPISAVPAAAIAPGALCEDDSFDLSSPAAELKYYFTRMETRIAKTIIGKKLLFIASGIFMRNSFQKFVRRIMSLQKRRLHKLSQSSSSSRPPLPRLAASRHQSHSQSQGQSSHKRFNTDKQASLPPPPPPPPSTPYDDDEEEEGEQQQGAAAGWQEVDGQRGSNNPGTNNNNSSRMFSRHSSGQRESRYDLL